jgi:hypothetical protein
MRKGVVVAVITVVTLCSCRQVTTPQWQNVTHVVWYDMETRVSLDELKQDVKETTAPGTADPLTVIDDTLTVLEDHAAFSSTTLTYVEYIHALVHAEQYDAIKAKDADVYR